MVVPKSEPKCWRSPVRRISALDPSAAARTGWSLGGKEVSGQAQICVEICSSPRSESNPGIQSGFFAEMFLRASSITPGWASRWARACNKSSSFRMGLPIWDPEKRILASRKTFTSCFLSGYFLNNSAIEALFSLSNSSSLSLE